MDFEEVFGTVDTLIFRAENRRLSEAERVVLLAAWENNTYEQAAAEVGYSASYLKRDIGPKLWKRLSSVLSESVGKKSFKLRFQQFAASHQVQPSRSVTATIPVVTSVFPAAQVTRPRHYWGNLDISTANFVGREAALNQLKDKIENGSARVINLWGEAGVGKTAVAIKLAEELQSSFDFVFYYSLEELSTTDLFSQLITFLADKPASDLPQTPAQQTDWILQHFSQWRCLVILDAAESVFAAGQLPRQYRAGGEGYRDLLRAVSGRPHRSCLLWVGQEKATHSGAAIVSHPLTGLSLEEVKLLLQSSVSEATVSDWQTLHRRYEGNPRYLLAAAASLETLFQGQLAQFLQQPLELDIAISQSLKLIFQRLSPAEQQVMYWLAIAHDPLTLEELQKSSVNPVREHVILALIERSLCVSDTDAAGKAILKQSPLLQLYCLQHFRQQVQTEFDQSDPCLLNSHALLQAKAKEAIQQKQRHQILLPLAEHVRRAYPDKQAMVAKIQLLLDAVRTLPLRHGYGAGNLVNLCQQLNLPVSAFTWSQLSLRQADFQRANLHGLDLSHTALAETVFAKPLGKSPVAAFHPTEPLLATGDDEGRLILWQLDSGKPQQILSNMSGAAVQDLAFSADGLFLAEGAEDNLRLWNLQQEQPYIFEPHFHAVCCLALSLENNMLASGSEDGSIRLWDIGSADSLAVLTETVEPITALSFSPDGRWLMGCSEAQTIHCWDIYNQTEDQFRNGTDSLLCTAAFLPATALDAEAKAEAWLPIAVSWSDRNILLWRIHENRPWCRLPERLETPPAAIALSADGRYLAYSQQSRQVTLWCLANETRLPSPTRFEQPISFLRFSPDSRFLAIGSDYQVQLWDLEKAQVWQTWQGSRHPVSSFAGDFNQNLLVSGHRDASVRVWQVNLYSNHSRCQQVFKHQNWVRTLAISPDGAWLASGSDDCYVHLRSTAVADSMRLLSGHTDPVRSLAFDPTSEILASAGQDGTIRLWQVETGALITQLLGHTATVYALAFSADGRWLASGDDQSIRLWEIATGRFQSIEQAHSRRIHRLQLDAEGAQLLSGSFDEQVKLWQLPTATCLQTWQQPQHKVGEVLFCAGNLPRVVSSCDRTLAFWSLDHDQPHYTRQAHEMPIQQTALSANGQHLLSLSTDAEIGIWEITSGIRWRALHIDRPYERLNIRDAVGLEALEKQVLQLLGAVEL
ncbi:NACHT domain-containing protein [Sphaerothrix gracilis]|uniref:NACHT domain-containing protein n=1 Tax=Sphaerothrix gracilis TaxID=3151835 RepID=UPI0031FBD191